MGSRLAEVMGAEGAAEALVGETLKLLHNEEPLPAGLSLIWRRPC